MLDLMLPELDGWALIEELLIDPHVVQAFVGGESAELTPTEFRLLHALALERGRVVTRDELMQRLWGRRQTRRDRTVDVFIRKLRDKIDRGATHHEFIHTRYGVGYKFEPGAKNGRTPQLADASAATSAGRVARRFTDFERESAQAAPGPR